MHHLKLKTENTGQSVLKSDTIETEIPVLQYVTAETLSIIIGDNRR